jgi:isopentenyl phosphate kinase
LSTKPRSPLSNLTLLKLGGSLITDKSIPFTPRHDALTRLAGEIAAARQQSPDDLLVVGNGAGSFGHVPAKKYGTRQGVYTAEEWRGFAEVWWEASALNRLVAEAFYKAGLPVISLPPSTSVSANDGKVAHWDMGPLTAALANGLLPLIYGDVIFDAQRGGTIFSTEDLFDHVARQLHPRRILLAGIEAGVWADYPHCTRLIPEITPANFGTIVGALGGSHATDVTGGMASKVTQSLELVKAIPGLEVWIFSGEESGAVQNALAGSQVGTVVKGD